MTKIEIIQKAVLEINQKLTEDYLTFDHYERTKDNGFEYLIEIKRQSSKKLIIRCSTANPEGYVTSEKKEEVRHNCITVLIKQGIEILMS